jgi:hypothetical protein
MKTIEEIKAEKVNEKAQSKSKRTPIIDQRKETKNKKEL